MRFKQNWSAKFVIFEFRFSGDTATSPQTPQINKAFKLNRWTVGVTTAVAIVATIATHVFGWGKRNDFDYNWREFLEMLPNFNHFRDQRETLSHDENDFIERSLWIDVWNGVNLNNSFSENFELFFSLKFLSIHIFVNE